MELLNTVIEWLKETDIPLSKISKHTGIDRKTLHNWKSGSKPNYKVYLKLRDYYVKHNSEKQKIPLTATGTIDSEYVIKLQQQRIDDLEKQKSVTNEWEDLDYDVKQLINLKVHSWVPLYIERSILQSGDVDIWKKYLGYTEEELEEYFQVGKYHSLSEHPIRQIVTSTSNTMLNSILDVSKTLMQLLRNSVGIYYIPFQFTFIAKDGSCVPCVAYCLIDWETMDVKAKVKFFG